MRPYLIAAFAGFMLGAGIALAASSKKRP